MTRKGQLIFFAQFLHTGDRWEEFVEKCPLGYEGNSGSKVVDVLGTSVLCGQWCYAHINAVRGDNLNPPLLGITGTVSEDVIRRAMKRIDERTGLAWLSEELRGCVEPVLSVPWILASTVRASRSMVISREPRSATIRTSPAVPAHCYHYHSYFMANTRLCLGVEVLGAGSTPPGMDCPDSQGERIKL